MSLATADVSGNLPANVIQWNTGALPTIGTSTLSTTDLDARGITTANKAQTGDGYSYLTTNLGAAGAAATEAGGTGDQFTALGDTRIANLDAAVSTRSSHTAANVVTALGTGSTLTALAPAATALSSVVWTGTKAGYIDAAISSVSGLDAAGVRTALGMANADMDDQLDAILVQATAAAGASGGTGARTCVITVNDGSTALEGARVRVTKGAETYAQDTNVSGQVTFNLNDGSWAVAITLAGYTYGGTTLIVNGDETATYSMTAASFTPSTEPNTVTVRWRVRMKNRTWAGLNDQTVYMAIKEGPGSAGIINASAFDSDTTDANGYVEFTNTPVGSRVAVKVGTDGAEQEVDIPIDAASPYDAAELSGGSL
jgi:hypothetical protein